MCLIPDAEAASSGAPQKTDAELAREAENLRIGRRQSQRGFESNFFAPVANNQDDNVRRVVLGA